MDSSVLVLGGASALVSLVLFYLIIRGAINASNIIGQQEAQNKLLEKQNSLLNEIAAYNRILVIKSVEKVQIENVSSGQISNMPVSEWINDHTGNKNHKVLSVS